jgi:hypothetical protein
MNIIHKNIIIVRYNYDYYTEILLYISISNPVNHLI